VKTQQAGKGLAGAVVICEWWEIGGGAVIVCSSSRALKWSINPISNPHPIYSHVTQSLKKETSPYIPANKELFLSTRLFKLNIFITLGRLDALPYVHACAMA
jgi:hypothetical protein